MCFDGSEECATSIFRVTILLAWIQSGSGITSKSLTNYGQSGSLSWLRAPVGTHDEILISVIGKKEMRRLCGKKKLKEIWPIRAMGEAGIELATSK